MGVIRKGVQMRNAIKICKSILERFLSLWPLFTLIICGIFFVNYFDDEFFLEHSKWAPQIANGVLSGFVTAILLGVFSVAFRKHLIPRLEEIQYRGVKVEGVWFGVLVPYLGIEDIDQERIKVGIAEVRRRQVRRKKQKIGSSENVSSPDTRALTIDSDGNTRDIKTEFIEKEQELDDDGSVLVKRGVVIAVKKFPTIEVRAEIRREGYKVFGEVVEIGSRGTMQTYDIKGSFKNLIVTAEYESRSSEHIDRGSLSLMLESNGQKLRGFFSSYEDNENRILPFRCILFREAEWEAYNKALNSQAKPAGTAANAAAH